MKTKTRSITLIIGSLLAVAIVFSQLFNFQVNAYSKKEVKTEQQKNEKAADETFLSVPSFSIPAPLTVQANFDSYCLFEILFEHTEEANGSEELPSFPKKLLITLFRVIISPNAP